MDQDSELLTRFAAGGDESAFRGIVERHAGMVLGVAWRRTQDRALAEEITQTVFTILARKARSIRHSELAGWLHRAAYMETLNAVRKESRRRAALQEYSAQTISSMTPETTWEELQPHLDGAIARLSPAERQLVVMRYFEQRSYREIADTTGKSEEASRKQLQRSLERLGTLLRTRGLSTSAATLAGVLGSQTLCIPPASAAAIGAVALQASAISNPSVVSTIITNMPAITKATIATIAAAVVPMTFLIQKNKSISHELDALRQQIATAPPHPAPAPLPAPAAPPAATLETDGPELPADSQSSDPQDNTDPIASAVADLFSSDALVQTFKDGARRNVKRELTQLKLRLKLTDSQEATLREFLEEQQSGELRVVQKLVQTGALKRLMKNPDDPQPEDIASLKELETESKNRPNRDEFIESILTAGQRTEYAKYREERRIADAEQTAQQALDDIAGTVDLTPDQKDRLFQALAQRELKKPRPAATDSTKSIVSDLIHFGPEDGDSSDEILKQHLTPEQFEALQGSRRDDAGNEGPSR